MKVKEDLRESLNDSQLLKFIKFSIKRRGFIGDSDTLEEITSAVVETLLHREDYYTDVFKYGLKTYVGQVITEVLGKLSRNPDALNGELVFLDAPSGAMDGEFSLTGHEIICQDDSMMESEREFTRPGVPNMITYYLTKLPDQQADVFALKAVYGHSHKEIADLLNISEAYSKELFLEAKRELHTFRDSERAHEAKMQIGNVSGRIITNECSDAGVWNDWAWREEHNVPGPVTIIKL